MARQSRQPSGTGIYYVMMRGINHQNIFEEHEDYYQFLNTLDMMVQSYEPDGTPLRRNYILYAYCLMSNHIYLLIRERENTIGMAIKRIAKHSIASEAFCMNQVTVALQNIKIRLWQAVKILKGV